MRAPAPLLNGLGLAAFLFMAFLAGRGFYERNEWQRYLSDFSAPVLKEDASSGTGWAAGQRLLIPADRRPESYEWIAQAQGWAAGGPAALAEVAYDNAPTGRSTSFQAPYRLWLGFWGKLWGTLLGQGSGRGVEAAARWVEPLTLGLAALSTLVILWRVAGWGAAFLVSAGWFSLFGSAAAFAPGQPQASGLSFACAGVAAILITAGRPSWFKWGFASVLVAVAAWTQPSVAWVVCLSVLTLALLLGLSAWRGAVHEGRRLALAGLAGLLVAVAAFALVWFWVRGAREAVLQALDIAALGLAGALLSWSRERSPRLREVAVAVVAFLWVPGAVQQFSTQAHGGTFSDAEAAALVERDLAFWLAERTAGEQTVVLAPAALSQAVWYHGGMKAVVTPNLDNSEGFKAGVRLCGASSADEARALFEARGITHIILPTWDQSLFDMAKLGSPEPDKGFLSLLIRWNPPRWLRPIPYQMPGMAGWENHSVAIFEVVETQDNATALARLADYFAQSGRPREAAAVAKVLEDTFPDELVSLVAQGQAARLQRDATRWKKVWEALQMQLEAGNDEGLEWSDRVGLSLLLIEAKQLEQGKPRLEALLATATEPLLRKLGPITLFRVLRASQVLRLDWPNATLRQQAEALLPSEYRDQLSAPR